MTPTRWNGARRRTFFGVLVFAAAMTIAACEPADPATDPLAPGADPGVVTPAVPDVAEPAPAPAAPDALAPAPGGLTDMDAIQIRDRLDEVTARLDAVEQRLATMAQTAETQELANEALQEVDQAMTILAEVRQDLDNFGNGPAEPDADPLAPAEPAPAAPGN